MRLDDLEKERRNTKRNVGSGNYIAYSVSEKTKDDIRQWLEQNNIPVEQKTLKNGHLTLIYSTGKDLPDGIARENINPITIASSKIKPDLFPGQFNNDCLVLTFSCPDAVSRHDEIRKDYGATHDYPDFKPHVTVSYNMPEGKDLEELTEVDFPIVFDFEYQEPID